MDTIGVLSRIEPPVRRRALVGDGHTPVEARRPGSKQPIVGLDLLRFVAAMAVVGFHLGFTSWADPHSDAAALLAGTARFPWLVPVTRMGWLGVEMFFLISGFVIAYSAQGSSAARFFRSRSLRLMPGIWICATVTFGLSLALSTDGGFDLVGRYLRTLIVFPVPRWIDGVYWTLSIEMVFYALVWALLLRRRLDRLESIMLAIGLVSTLVWELAATDWWPGLDILAGKRVAQLCLVTHGSTFALGVLIWRIANDGISASRLLGALACLAGTLCQIHAVCDEVRLAHAVAQPYAEAAGLFLAFVALFILAIAANGILLRRLPPRLLSATRLLGLSTYPLYLLHTAVGAVAIRAARTLGVAEGPSLIFGVSVAIAVSILVARFVEPVLRARLAGMTVPRFGRLTASRA